MSQDSTQAVGANAKPVTPTNETIAATFGEFAKVAQQALVVALKGGVNASAIMAVVAYKVAMFNGSKAQTHFLLFGTEKPAKHDSGEAKLWRAGYALAGHWRFAKALPATIAAANSEEAAFVAACAWLEGNKITSLVGLEDYLAKAKGVDASVTERAKTPLPERIGKAIAKAEKEGELSIIDAAKLGTLAGQSMSLANARAFAEAATAAHDAKAALAANAAAKLLETEEPDFQPEAQDGTNG